MNTDGISPQQLANALANPAIPDTSAGTINFVGEGIIAVVDEEGMIVTVYRAD